MAESFLASPMPTQSIPDGVYEEALLSLQRLRLDLASNSSNQARFAEGMQLATAILERLASFGLVSSQLAKPFRSTGAKLLKMALAAGQAEVEAMLAALLSLCKLPLKIFIALASFIKAGGSSEYMRQALEFLSDPTRPQLWQRGLVLRRILQRHNMSPWGFQGTKELYTAFQDAGLYHKFQLPRANEYEIRMAMATMAIEAGDKAFASSEMASIQALTTPDTLQLDVKLQSKLALHEARAGQWDSALGRVEEVGRQVDTGCRSFQALLTLLTHVHCRSQSATEVEQLVRSLVAKYQLIPRPAWVFRVLDMHASRREEEAALSWLQFCGESGLVMDDAFVDGLLVRCRKYWCFSDSWIAKLQKLLVASWAHGPVDEEADRKRAQAHGRKYSGDRLRTAVVDALRDRVSGVRTAVCLVRSAHERGEEVEEALTPLLLARLLGDEDPARVMGEALQMQVRLHDAVYNRAARALMAWGQMEAAADVCRLAARENGSGRLLYSRYNFANLVFAYTGTTRYQALLPLLDEFTSEVLWWRGNRLCKETIKLAMKATVRRVVMDGQDWLRHKTALG
ncbi:hypothetical protein CDD83_8088 [Cordyceps sp. RAO-2017]|nr:hypothetical protein CDD83_8088 [Cordyceps sp. RAO-2017]